MLLLWQRKKWLRYRTKPVRPNFKKKMKKIISLFTFYFCVTLIITKPCFAESTHFSPPQILPSSQQDPLEKSNRWVFRFNQEMDTVFITPISKIYNTLIPNPIRTGADNAFDNIAMLSTTANDLLQGEFKHGINDAWRFIINTTLGVGGIFDVASKFGIPKHFNDMGITLAKWGYRNSTYLVIPFLGSMNVRDGIGLLGDYYLFSPYPYIASDSIIYGILTYRYLTIKAQLLEANDIMNEIALDPYTFTRDAYYQYRNHKINSDSNMDNSEYMYLQENENQDTISGVGYVPDETHANAVPVNNKQHS